MLISAQFLKLLQDDKLLLFLFNCALLLNGDGILGVGNIIFNLLLLNALRKLLQFLLNLALVLHKIWKKSFSGDTSDLVRDVNLNDVLSEHLEVEIPPAKIHEREAAVKEFKCESLDDETVLVS